MKTNTKNAALSAAAKRYFTQLAEQISADFAKRVEAEYKSFPATLRDAVSGDENISLLGRDVPGHPWDNNLAYHRTRLAERALRSRDTLVAPPQNAKRQSPPTRSKNNAPSRNPADSDKSVAAPYAPQAELLGFLGSPNLRTPGTARALIFADGGTVAVSADNSGTFILWDMATGRELRRFHTAGRVILCCAISQDQSTLVTDHCDGTLQVWDATSGTPLRTLSGHTDTVTCCAMTADATRIVSGSGNKTLRLWDATSGELLETYDMGSEVYGISMHA